MESGSADGRVAGVAGIRAHRGLLLRSLGRIVLIIVVLLVVYGLLPASVDDLGVLAIVIPAAGVVLFAVVFGRSLRKVSAADHPGVRGLEALTLVTTFFVVFYAYYYTLLSTADPESFTEPLSKVGAFYFTITVLTTTGFGDISAATDGARVAVTIQMVLSVLFVGVAVRLVLRVAQTARQQRAAGPSDSGAGGSAHKV